MDGERVSPSIFPPERGGSKQHFPESMMDPIQAFRNMSPQQQAQEGEDSLLAHLLEKGIAAHQKYPGLGMDSVDTFLADRDCVRYATRLVFEYGAEMAPHQFAQPERDFRSTQAHAKVLYLRPALRESPRLAIAAVAYMLPLLNYGDIIRDEHCLVYASALLGLTEDECYELMCEVADFVDGEVKYEGEVAEGTPVPEYLPPLPQESDCSCGGGCGCS